MKLDQRAMPGAIAPIFLALGLGLTAIGAASPADAQTVRVGIVPVEPYGGTPPGGYFFDVMSEIAKRAEIDIEFTPTPFGDLAPALAAGTIDVIAGPAGSSAAGREAGYAYTGPTMMIQEALIVPATDGTPYTAMADFAGQAVGVIAGTTTYINTLNAAGVTDVRTYTVPADAVQALQTGEIKAFFQSRPQFAFAQEVRGMFPEMRIVDSYQPIITTYSALISRRAAGLVGPLHAALEEIKADGTLATLAEKWRQALPPF